ncbi:MAG TPA: Hpt domain-containing protein, partial [Gammaproteobacteria bacterium]|nr:Hpt domain-containing protein [Gammaproteobacteria bacterium]
MNANDENESLLNIFLEEAKDLLDAISATLQVWSKDLNNKSCFADLKRDLHTLKGGARMVNQPALSSLAHETESFCESLFAGRIPADRQAYEKVCASQDQMLHIVEGLFSTTPVVSTNDSIKPESGADVARAITKKPAVVLVVDDSVTIRTVTKNFL